MSLVTALYCACHMPLGCHFGSFWQVFKGSQTSPHQGLQWYSDHDHFPVIGAPIVCSQHCACLLLCRVVLTVHRGPSCPCMGVMEIQPFWLSMMIIHSLLQLHHCHCTPLGGTDVTGHECTEDAQTHYTAGHECLYNNFYSSRIGCLCLHREQRFSSSRRLSAQTRQRTHRNRATQQSYSAQPGVVRGFRLGTRQTSSSPLNLLFGERHVYANLLVRIVKTLHALQ